MIKKIILVFLLFVIFLMIGIFAYFYYIKPQREYVKVSEQNCVNKAMAPINNEVGKNEYGTHYSDGWFTAPLKKQEIDLAKCIEAYNNILFSAPEKNLLELNLNSLVDAQAAKIDIYKKAYLNIVSENQKQQGEIDKCNQAKAKYQEYQTCVSNASKNGQFSNNCVYPQDAINNSFGCAMMGISIY